MAGRPRRKAAQAALARVAITDPELLPPAPEDAEKRQDFTRALRIIADAQRAGLLTPAKRAELAGILSGALRVSFAREDYAVVAILARVLAPLVEREPGAGREWWEVRVSRGRDR